MSMEQTRAGFEESFAEGAFYNKQTQDEKHLQDIMTMLQVKPEMKILDLGCGSGYLTFAIAKACAKADVVGLDIVGHTLEQNEKKAREEGLNNVSFVSYDGTTFPFEAEHFDLVVTRYALHHFPAIQSSIGEVARVLKPEGRFFISDPRPNDCDTTRFVDDYMRLKKDGHIKFYTKDEWIEICGIHHMKLIDSFDSKIRFPKKMSTAEGYRDILTVHDRAIIDSYQLTETEDEIWITEQVNNLMFAKNRECGVFEQ